MFGSSSDGNEEGEDVGRVRRWWALQRDLWLEPKHSAVARIVDRWWGRWSVLVILPAALVSLGNSGARECGLTVLIQGGCLVCDTIPSV